jgi:hypothetical protein
MLPTLLRDLGQNVPQQGIHTKGYTRLFNLGMARSPQPRRGGLQSPNRTVTPVGTVGISQPQNNM